MTAAMNIHATKLRPSSAFLAWRQDLGTGRYASSATCPLCAQSAENSTISRHDLDAPRAVIRVRPVMIRSLRPLSRLAATVGVAAIALFASACGYNEVVNRDQDVQAAWAEVE